MKPGWAGTPLPRWPTGSTGRHRRSRRATSFEACLMWADVAATGKADARAAPDLSLTDFEDALQVAATMACGAQSIVICNLRGLGKWPVPALSPDSFLWRHGSLS